MGRGPVSARYVVCLVVLALALTAALAEAQGPRRTVTGLSIIDNGSAGLNADFDIQLTTVPNQIIYGTQTIYGRTATITGHLGSQYSWWRGGTSPARALGVLYSPFVGALDFGDGSSAAVSQISAVTPGTGSNYRGNFVYSYAAPGTYTVTAGAVFNFFDLRATTAPLTPAVGNPVRIYPGTSHSFVSVYYFFGPASTNTIPFFYTRTPGGTQTVGVTNTAQITVGAQQPPVLAIPTVSEIGLFVLALLMACAGLFFLRR